MNKSVVMRAAGEGPATWAMGGLFERLVGATETGGSLGVSRVSQPPGIATPLHRHTHEAEALFLLEGAVSYLAGEDLFELAPGSFIYLPEGLPHAFRIRGARPAQFLVLTVPVV